MSNQYSFVYFDLETTGLNQESDKIIEIAAYSSGKTFQSLINPGIPIPENSFCIHGISDEMVKNSPSFETVSSQFISFCNQIDQPVMVAHNGDAFDFPFLKSEMKKVHTQWPSHWSKLDSMKWAKKYRPDLQRHSLQFLRGVFEIKENGAHRAMNDTFILKEVFEMLIGNLTAGQVLNCMKEKCKIDVMPFGKYQGKLLKELPSSYLSWLSSGGILDNPSNYNLKTRLVELKLIN